MKSKSQIFRGVLGLVLTKWLWCFYLQYTMDIFLFTSLITVGKVLTDSFYSGSNQQLPIVSGQKVHINYLILKHCYTLLSRRKKCWSSLWTKRSNWLACQWEVHKALKVLTNWILIKQPTLRDGEPECACKWSIENIHQYFSFPQQQIASMFQMCSGGNLFSVALFLKLPLLIFTFHGAFFFAWSATLH